MAPSEIFFQLPAGLVVGSRLLAQPKRRAAEHAVYEIADALVSGEDQVCVADRAGEILGAHDGPIGAQRRRL